MPLLKIETTADLSEEKQRAVLAALSPAVAAILGKPEQYLMVTCARVAMMMSGSYDPTAWGDLRSIGGLSAAANVRLTQHICRILQEHLGIPPERVYLNFTDVAPGNWGWNSTTFAQDK